MTPYVVKLMFDTASGPVHTEQQIQASCATEAFNIAEDLRRKASASIFNINEGILEDDTASNDSQTAPETRRRFNRPRS